MHESPILINMLCRGQWDDRWTDFLDFDILLDLAARNKVLSTLAHFIFARGIENTLKGTEAFTLLRQALLINQRDERVYRDSLAELLPLFADNGIDVILLKGLSLGGYGPRDTGDLDLLIKPEELKKSIELLLSLGYIYTGGERGFHKRRGEAGDWDRLLKWSNQFEFLHRKRGLLIELHTNFFERYRVYHINLDPLLDKIDQFRERAVYSEDLGCRILSCEDRLLLLAVHNSLKRSAPKKMFALRNIIDMKYLIEREEPNWNSLFNRSEETETLVYVIYSLQMVKYFYQEFPSVPSLEKAISRLKEEQRHLMDVMHKCYGGLGSVREFYTFLFHIILPFAVPSRIGHKIASLLILPVLFAPPWRLRQLYGLPKNSPLFVFTYLLEPLRWVRVAMKNHVETDERNGSFCE